MASRARLKEHLTELEVEFDERTPTVELAKIFVKEVKKIGHADDFSPALIRTLIDDYYFEIVDEEGNKLDENLEVRE